MLKHLALLIALLTCLGCASKQPQSPSSTSDFLPPTTQQPAPAPAPLTQPPTVPPPPKTVAQAQDVPPTTTAKTTPAVTQPALPAVQQAPVQPLLPTPDVPAFKDEPLISLEGRVLNPHITLPPRSDKQFNSPWTGEQLKFGLYYAFVKAGTAYIKNRGVVSINNRPAYLIQTSAFSAPVIDTVFKVRDINFSWLDVQDLHSLGYSQSLREGNYRRDEWVNFDYDAKKYYGKLAKKSGTRDIHGPLNQPMLDMLTALYYVRGQKLENGKDIVFDIINREEQYPLVVKVVGRETVKTPAGKFKCIIVEPQFRGEGIFVSKGKNLKVWLTDDDYKMPVKMKTEVFIGSVSAELLEYKRN